jgi:hypothetical protein
MVDTDHNAYSYSITSGVCSKSPAGKYNPVTKNVDTF